MVVELLVEDGRVCGIEMQDSRRVGARAVVLATGTFLNGLIHTGRRTYTAGRAGEPASVDLAENLKRLGFKVGRLKTGTPPRLDGRTIHWDAFEKQPGDERPVPFSFATESIGQPQINCHIGYTSDALHDKIRDNIHESPLYSGQIQGVGPRYCPSIEDKVVKFADKNRHQLFLEPEGHDTNEVYLNGFSTSLPAELQQDLLRMIPGFEDVRIIRPGYAIEYDFVDPRELTPMLETVKIKGLFHAGQINGTTGYEEAACQGFVAGVNAALSVQGRPSFRLRREESYIGVLIDDLITQGVDEPYRLFTSRAENRLALRHDNADARLTQHGRELGLVGDESWERFNQRQTHLAASRDALLHTRFKRSDAAYASICYALNVQDLGDSITLAQLAHRPGVTPEFIQRLLPANVCRETSLPELESALADSLYSGYIAAQGSAQARLYANDALHIPDNFNYHAVSGLSREMVERFERARPQTFGQARRVPGVTPGALSTLLVNVMSLRRAA
jgi:tRNA uridine 5-carboxymethylaminomethyl modification enzyme